MADENDIINRVDVIANEVEDSVEAGADDLGIPINDLIDRVSQELKDRFTGYVSPS